jgi:hypothetical protein
MREPYRKFIISAACLVLVLVAALGIVDDYGRDYTDRGFKRALVTFAVARGLNGVISVAQGTEVAIQPAGIGLNFTPGQILDPVNDLVERFSWVMLASSTSLGIQKVLMGILSSRGFTLLLGATLLFLVVLLWWRRDAAARMRPLVYRTAIALLLLRFSIPVVALLGEGVFQLFLADQYQTSTAHIEKTAEEIGHINRRTESAVSGLAYETLLDRAKRYYENAASQMDVQGHIERYKAAAADASEHAINLIVIFVLQTMLFPLLYLWLIVRLFRRLMRMELLGGASAALA